MYQRCFCWHSVLNQGGRTTVRNFARELSRRDVFRVGITYIVVSWLVSQVVELALDSFDAPDWIIKTVLLVLVLGFPSEFLSPLLFPLGKIQLDRPEAEYPQERVPGVHRVTGHAPDNGIENQLAVENRLQ